MVLFVHSLLSDWNHGNAHFLRGLAWELQQRGHEIRIYEPHDAWSLQNLLSEHGPDPVRGFRAAYPGLDSIRYKLDDLDPEEVLARTDLVLVHEWNEPALVRKIGGWRNARGGFRLLFHDTHHRSVSEPGAIAAFDLRHYDGVLAFGDALRDLYRARGWASRAWTWREAADTRVFRPLPGRTAEGDLVWIGNWGDEERTAELYEYFLAPVRKLGLKARAHGVRYPEAARADLAASNIDYGGWLPNFEVPEVFARFRMTIHIPRRPYLRDLPGVPTIRPFEAMACGIPLVMSPWEDTEGLFEQGTYLLARDGEEMTALLARLLDHPEAAQAMAGRARTAVLARHTCAHRADELFRILEDLETERRTGGTKPRGARSPQATVSNVDGEVA